MWKKCTGTRMFLQKFLEIEVYRYLYVWFIRYPGQNE